MIAKHDVVVVGGGVVGAALALALKRAGIDVALVERGKGPKPFDANGYDLRVYAIAPGTARFLDALGVWPRIEMRRVSAYEEMRVWSETALQALNFRAAEARRAELGWIVENDLILDELWKALAGVTIYRGVEVATHQGSTLTLSDGREIRAGLIAACDGADSRVRELAGIEIESWDYPQRAIVCHVATERPHRRSALQRFLPTGPLAFLPLADGRSSIVWSTTEADALMQLDDAQFRERLADAIQHELGAIAGATQRVVFPLRLLHARDYVRDNVVLLGDAAHVVHPLAGQGVNLGLADAEKLASLLAARRAAKASIASPRALAAYQRARKADNVEMLALTDALYRVFGQTSPVLGSTLQLGMQILDRLTPIKARLAQRALGLA
ncbi:MAG TPA: FAD-dependent oxidoreductase [Nevskiaceae bacterium]|nr:FAD-dependent oxidoreductase [Nevskiaceae bacterium]